MNEKKPWGFCETPEENCTMNYCDENGCQNRNRDLVEPVEKMNKKDFVKFLQKDVGTYGFRDIIDNLTDDQIIDAVNDFIESQTVRVDDEIKKPISKELIGNVKERFNQIFKPVRRWNVWTGFYNGWIEGRVDMMREVKELQDKLDRQNEVIEMMKEFIEWIDECNFNDPTSEEVCHSMTIKTILKERITNDK